jgi:hypothetical protein
MAWKTEFAMGANDGWLCEVSPTNGYFIIMNERLELSDMKKRERDEGGD